MRVLKRMVKNDAGATAVEFAIVAGVFFMLVLAIMEYGLFLFTKVQVDAITQQAAREVGIGAVKAGCSDRVSCIIKLVNDKSVGLINPKSLSVTANDVTATGAAAPTTPDICLDNVNDPYPISCVKWVENNGAGGYQPATPLAAGALGTEGKLIEIRVTYLWRVQFPMFRSYFVSSNGQQGVATITSTTVVKNEPFGTGN